MQQEYDQFLIRIKQTIFNCKIVNIYNFSLKLKHKKIKKEHNSQTSRGKDSFAGCLENIIKFSKYFFVQYFATKIKYCRVAFSLLLFIFWMKNNFPLYTLLSGDLDTSYKKEIY